MRPLPRIATLLIALSFNLFLLPERVEAKSESLKQWLDGPVHYIIDPAEIKEFKSLKTDKDRAAFIERFWRRRDPTPETLVNEFRQMFWDRVREANEKFLDSSSPGWKTDRGKIYILYGPPSEVKEDPNAQATQNMGDSVGLIRWVYLKPGGRRDVDPVVFVPFVRDVTGEYRLSYDPKLSSPFFTWSQVDDNRTKGFGSFLTDIQPAKDPLTVLLDLGKMQEVPPQEVILLDSVETVETYAFEPLTLAIDRFQPGGAGLLVVLTLAIPAESGAGTPSIFARFSHGGAKSGAQILGEGSFRIEGDGAERIAQGRVQLSAAAPWDLTVLSVDPNSGVSRIYRGRVDPLAGGSGLRLSDVVLAREMAPLDYAAQASYDAPYIVGGFHVVPRTAPAVKGGEPLRVYFEIYGGAAPYHMTYQLEGKEKDGRWVPLGKPQEHDATERGQGYALDTKPTWPVGAYRISVKVTDSAGASTETVETWNLVRDTGN